MSAPNAVYIGLSALTMSHTVVLFHHVVYDTRVVVRNKIPLLICCLSHMISRIQFFYLFDPLPPRDCQAMVIVSNLFGLITFRFTLLYMLGQLCLNLNKNNILAKAAWSLSMLCWLGSSIILMYQEITAPFIIEEICIQLMRPELTQANNVLFLLSFVFMVAPITYLLSQHVTMS
ncbi:uncharacterized protein EV422DRAFT_288925 [Fimicolochytrium jonesii]|uniref:uncharacterized protein n=1 Tax=Fimicolochytrium jonesii TaxID=1396493 RepID=UPI0022FDB199|nr:uncharacterized protein EV422DRAFT_288925 [Fimicolochytrium jonesii]KAI8816549.1 hypothetical protein EV422DRAFT_288925 [Fimicolochytrium jonesii]